MNSPDAEKLLRSIDQTIVDLDSISGKDPLTDSYLAKFLVVYISGIYEEVIETIFVDFFSRNTQRIELVNYARSSVGRVFQNPNSEKILSLLSMTGNNTWVLTVKSMNNERLALDSIVTNKNSIAHGQGSIITLSDVKIFYIQSKSLIEEIDLMLN